LKVLVVDDQEIICELITEHLHADGHQAVGVSDPQIALEKLAGESYDLLITDQSMPGMSGEQLARAVKKTKAGLPVILLTGFGEEIKAQGKPPEGIDLVVGKPVSAVELRRAIAEAVK
jgi:two-component system cell cycle sensor histidine kinase/response regulator CckA